MDPSPTTPAFIPLLSSIPSREAPTGLIPAGQGVTIPFTKGSSLMSSPCG